jgi:hypothetical protein
LTSQVQFFAVGTSGTNFNIASATDTHTFNLPTASATNRGALASADWSTFNNKQNQLNGTGFVKASGTTITYDNSTYQVTSDKGQPNGYASLDGNGKVPLTQINDALIGNVNYQGLWNASTNNPTLVDPPSSGTKGYYYIVSTAGTFAGISFEVGDWIISNGSAWQKVDNTDAVSSVFGRTGNVTATNGDYNTSQVTENTNLYYTEARVSANTDVAANTAARHNAVTLGTANGLSLSTQQLSLQLATSGQNGALSSTDWTTFNSKENAITAGTTAQYFRGDKTFQTLNTGVVPESGNLYFTNARAIASVLTGYSSGAGTISAADSILSAIQKLNGNIGALVTGVSSVNGQTGVVVLTTTNIAEGTNLYYTEARVNANTNVAANTAARHGAVTLGTANGLSLSTQQLSLGLASAGVTGALSGTDWSTFNSKQQALNGTGFVKISGTTISYDNTNYLPLTGGTLTGALGGTSASFSGSLTSGGRIQALGGGSGTSQGGYLINNTGDANSRRWLLLNDFNVFGDFAILQSTTQTGSSYTSAFYIKNDGNIGVGTYTPPRKLTIQGADDTTLQIRMQGTAETSSYSEIGRESSSTGDFRINVCRTGTVINALRIIDTTGAAIFINTITATQFIRSGGTSSQFLKADGSVDSNSYYLASNPSAFIALTALSGTAPIQYNNTTGAISITQASGSTNGFLSSTDWNTFNNKTSNVGTVTSVAALTLGTTGTDLSSSVANGTTTPVITLNVPTASASNRGALSAADWTTFNGKENAITAGTTAQYYRGDKTFQTLNTAAVPELTNLYYTEARVSANTNVAANTAARHNEVTLGTANGLSLSTQQLSLGLASSSANGALSSTDWTTFNNKQNALTNPVTGTGTTNYLPKFTGSTTIGNSSIIDNGTGRVSIGTTSFLDSFVISNGGTTGWEFSNAGAVITYNRSTSAYIPMTFEASNYILNRGNLGLGVTPSAWASDFRAMQIGLGTSLYNNSNTNGTFLGSNFFFNGSNNIYLGTGTATAYGQSLGTHAWYTAPSGTAGNAISFTQAMTLGSNSGLSIGTPSAAPSQGLLVQGAVTLSSSVAVNGSNAIAALAIKESAIFPTAIAMQNRNSTQQWGIAVDAAAVDDKFLALIDQTNALVALKLAASTGAATFSSSVTATQFITGGTPSNTAGFTNSFYAHSNFPSITLSNTSTNTGKFTLGVTEGSFGIWNNTTNSYPFFINSSNNVLIGTTTDAGFKLDVNGTGRFSERLQVRGGGAGTSQGGILINYVANANSRSWILNNDFNVFGDFAILQSTTQTGTSYTAPFYIKNDGNIGVGTYTPPRRLTVQGPDDTTLQIRMQGTAATDSYCEIGRESSSTGDFRINVCRTGTVINALRIVDTTGAATFSSSVTATSFFESSDATLKTLVEDAYQAKGIDSVVAKLYIKNGKQELGYYAQDLEGVLPSAVSKGSNGLLNLSYREVHTAKIAYLEQKIKQLENELGRLS